MNRESIERVQTYYDSCAEREWERLERDNYHRLEFEVNGHFIRKYLPPVGRILDLGGGPGRYAIALAQAGYEVVLADLSAAALELAREKVAEHGVAGKVTGFVQTSATDLSRFRDAEFDGALVLGPLIHLIDEADRRAALAEVYRVLRPGAPVFVLLLARYNPIRHLLRSDRAAALLERPEVGRQLLATGVFRREQGAGWPDSWFVRPPEIRPFMESCGFATETLLASQGIVAFANEGFNRISDPAVLSAWRQLVLETCEDESIFGLAEHLLYVGRRPAVEGASRTA
jgi:ubiquinone/menaquinone biosynthesis C-methylase UbiE